MWEKCESQDRLIIKVWWTRKWVISTQTLHYKREFDQYSFHMKGISDTSFKEIDFPPVPIICLAVESCFPMKSLYLLIWTCYDSNPAWGTFLFSPLKFCSWNFSSLKLCKMRTLEARRKDPTPVIDLCHRGRQRLWALSCWHPGNIDQALSQQPVSSVASQSSSLNNIRLAGVWFCCSDRTWSKLSLCNLRKEKQEWVMHFISFGKNVAVKPQ